MSMYDWNGDGKKDSVDNFIEYQIYNDATKNSSNRRNSHSSNESISTFGAIGCVIGGLLATSMLFSGADLDKIPAIILILVWMVASFAIAAIIKTLRR